ncbi:MAG TPA: alkaline phosphatase family protein, partial [Dongiaceae bacterium]|nr:alkaline phosphatase family protein [Dongiaceae bacterium]
MRRGVLRSSFDLVSLLPALLLSLGLSQAGRAASLQPNDSDTLTPIKHVIVIIGENRTFDHVFGAYAPRPGQSVFNLLSQGIILPDGSPGPSFAKAAQDSAEVTSSYDIAPSHKQPYATLPPAMTDGAPQAASDGDSLPFLTLGHAAALDGGVLPSDLRLLLTGATGLPPRSIDKRMPNATSLPNGPYQLTPAIAYDAFGPSPVHRFFQMWQQLDCSAGHASADNPSGCLSDLFPWVEVSVGAGSNGKPQPGGFDQQTTGEGSTAMGFYNVNDGDAPYLKQLADDYTMSDNFHQSVNGGTGANHIMLGTGDMVWYSDGKGHAAVPPNNQIENPNPQAGTNNYYTQDGYSGGSYVACADPSQPGVGPILDYLGALPAKPKPNCEAGHYYLVNNYNPGYFGDGTVDTQEPFTVPPSNVPNIGDALIKKQVSFRYYGEGWNAYLQDHTSELYCNICNFLQYSPTIMTNAARRTENLKDLPDLYNDIRDETLPAVSFVKPSGLNDGHPASSKLDIFESFVHKIVDETRAQPGLWRETAIFVAFDEGGGYWDSGYIQPLDFFGDGPRIPFIVVSPFTTGGRVVHSYTDHVSILK